MNTPTEAQLHTIAHSGWILPPRTALRPLDGGLINHTVGVFHSDRLLAVLQRLNTVVFAPEVHLDIEAITAHLEKHGMVTPRLIPSVTGDLWHTAPDGGCWRMLTPVGSRTHHRADPPLAGEAGALLARFHRATADLEHRFIFSRPDAHDTARHLDALRTSLLLHRAHRLYDAVARLADELIDAWHRWEGPTALPPRIIHGDPKLSNIRFDDVDRAVALIDLDTLARGTLDVELGDALRSWCNPAGENKAEARVDPAIFEAAVSAYLREHPLPDEEREAIVPGLERIAIELAARFAQDALEECYFGFDPRYGGRGEHNLLRARGQASLAASVRAARPRLEAIVQAGGASPTPS